MSKLSLPPLNVFALAAILLVLALPACDNPRHPTPAVPAGARAAAASPPAAASPAAPGVLRADRAAGGRMPAPDAPGGGPLFEEMRYRVVIAAADAGEAARQLEALAVRFGIDPRPSIHAGGDNHLDIPREKYHDFLAALPGLGRLTTGTERFSTTLKPDAPIPFVIRFQTEASAGGPQP